MKPLLPLGEKGPPMPALALALAPPLLLLERKPPEPRGRKGGLSMLKTLSMTMPTATNRRCVSDCRRWGVRWS